MYSKSFKMSPEHPYLLQFQEFISFRKRLAERRKSSGEHPLASSQEIEEIENSIHSFDFSSSSSCSCLSSKVSRLVSMRSDAMIIDHFDAAPDCEIEIPFFLDLDSFFRALKSRLAAEPRICEFPSQAKLPSEEEILRAIESAIRTSVSSSSSTPMPSGASSGRVEDPSSSVEPSASSEMSERERDQREIDQIPTATKLVYEHASVVARELGLSVHNLMMRMHISNESRSSRPTPSPSPFSRFFDSYLPLINKFISHNPKFIERIFRMHCTSFPSISPSTLSSSWTISSSSSSSSSLDSFVAFTSLVTVIERFIGDIFYSLNPKTAVPRILRQLFVDQGVRNALGDSALLFLKTMIGPPVGMNLRNIM